MKTVTVTNESGTVEFTAATESYIVLITDTARHWKGTASINPKELLPLLAETLMKKWMP